MMSDYELGHATMDQRPKLNYYIRLESESSITSEEDTESVNSIQNRETEFAQDTADTDSDSYIEFEVASLPDNEEDPANLCLTSGSEDAYTTEEVIAAVLGDTSLEAWAPDGEDSYNTTSDSEDFGNRGFWTCAQCKSKNNNPQLRLCEKCYQVRKNFYPPRPKRTKKRKVQSNKEAVNMDNLRSCLSGLSQDSGLGLSQEFPTLDFKEIKVPEQHLNKGSSTSSGISSESSSGCSSNLVCTSDDPESVGSTTRKRKNSENVSNSDVRPKRIIIEAPLSSKIESTQNDTAEVVELNAELKEQCIMCMTKQKDGLFLHGSSAHACCCYKCAIKTWKVIKRCPVCNRRVSNVVKLYKI